MSVEIRGEEDRVLTSIRDVLRKYETKNPGAKIELYRRNPFSVRIRVIDPSFSGRENFDRHTKVWQSLKKLPGEVQGDISMVVLLAPGEEKASMANLEFEDPTPSLLGDHAAN